MSGFLLVILPSEACCCHWCRLYCIYFQKKSDAINQPSQAEVISSPPLNYLQLFPKRKVTAAFRDDQLAIVFMTSISQHKHKNDRWGSFGGGLSIFRHRSKVMQTASMTAAIFRWALISNFLFPNDDARDNWTQHLRFQTMEGNDGWGGWVTEWVCWTKVNSQWSRLSLKYQSVRLFFATKVYWADYKIVWEQWLDNRVNEEQ